MRAAFFMESRMTRSQFFTFGLIGLALSIASIFLLDQRLAPMVLSDQANLSTWHFISEMGDSKWMAILVITIWLEAFIFSKLRRKNPFWLILRKKAALVFTAVLVPGLLVLVIKFCVGRSRPYAGDLGFHPFTTGVDFASWPSGHSTTAFGFAVAVGMAFPPLRWPLLALAGLIGYSRMALNMHYLADVIAGATLGSVGAVLVYQWLAPKPSVKA